MSNDSFHPSDTQPPFTPLPPNSGAARMSMGEPSSTALLPPIQETLQKRQKRLLQEQARQQRLEQTSAAQAPASKPKPEPNALEKAHAYAASAAPRAAKTPASKQSAQHAGLKKTEKPPLNHRQERVSKPPYKTRQAEPEKTLHSAKAEGAFQKSRMAAQDKLAKRYQNARKRHMTLFQYRRQQKQKSVWFKRTQFLLKLLVSMALLYVAVIFYQAPFWQLNTQQTQISGNSLVPAHTLKHLVNAYEGQALYNINPQVLASTLQEKLPLIQQLSINRRIHPQTLTSYLDIQVDEKRPWVKLYRSISSNQPYGLLLSDNQFIPWVGLKLSPKLNTQVDTLPSIILAPAERTKLQDNNPLWKNLHLLTWQIQYLAAQPVKPASVAMDHDPQKTAPQASQAKEVKPFQLSELKHAQVLLANQGKSTELIMPDGVRVHLGSINRNITEKLERLWSSLPVIQAYPTALEAIDLQWHQQVVLQKQGAKALQAKQQALSSPPGSAVVVSTNH